MSTYDIYIDRVHVLPSHGGHENVVAAVFWQFICTDGEFVSAGGGETLLDVSQLDDFTPAAQLTESQVASWIQNDLEARGLYAELVQYHTAAIEAMQMRKSLAPWNEALADAKARPVASAVILQV